MQRFVLTFFLLILFLPVLVHGTMVGPSTYGTLSQSNNGAGQDAWILNDTNAMSCGDGNDGTCAGTVTLVAPGGGDISTTSEILKLTNFDLQTTNDDSSSNISVEGIKVTLRRKANYSTAGGASIFGTYTLLNEFGTFGNSKGDSNWTNGSTWETVELGGSTDNWGYPGWMGQSSNSFRNPHFGVGIQVSSGTNNDTAAIDYVQVTVWFTDTRSPSVELPRTPADDATDVSVSTNLVLNFNERMQKGRGTLTVYRAADDVPMESVAINSDRVTLSAGDDGNDTFTVNLVNNLQPYTNYYVQYNAGAFEDIYGNDAPALNDETTWNFRTVDAAPYAYFQGVAGGGVNFGNGCGEASPWNVSTNSDAFDLNITFNEPVSGFEIGDITVVGADLSNFNDRDDADASTYQVHVANAFGRTTLTIPAARVVDLDSGLNNTETSYVIQKTSWWSGCCVVMDGCVDGMTRADGTRTFTYLDDETGLPFARATLNLGTANPDQSNLEYSVDAENRAAFFHTLNGLTGVSNICLLVPRDAEDTQVRYCSGAQEALCTEDEDWSFTADLDGMITENGDYDAGDFTVTATTAKNKDCEDVLVWEICGPITSGGQSEGGGTAVPEFSTWVLIMLAVACGAMLYSHRDSLA